MSDLHLCDLRNEGSPDDERLAKLARFICSSGAGAVLNLGDTISRKPFLRPEYASEREAFEVYLTWRSQFTIPFAECAVEREKEFFAGMMRQEPDSLMELPPDAAIITLLPGNTWRSFTSEQLEFLTAALERSRGKTVVIGTHVPFPGSCSREQDVFLQIPEHIMELLTNFPGKIIWCGGHFHWKNEPPAVSGSLAALYASRFALKTLKDTSYTAMIDTATGKITFDHHNF